MARQRTRHDETTSSSHEQGHDTRRHRQLQQREDRIQRETGRRDSGRGLEHFRNPMLLLAGGLASYAGLKRFGHLSSLFFMGVGGGLIYRALSKNNLLDGHLKQRILQTAASGTTHLHTAITVDLPVEEVFDGWRSLENLAKSMRHIDSVDPIDGEPDRWHFRARIPGIEMPIEWDAEIVEERAHEHLSWRSTQEADLQHEGMVEFRPCRGGDCTEVHVDLLYHPPAGEVGEAIGRFLQSISEKTVKRDVRAFKQYLETGVVATTDGQPSGREQAPARTTPKQARPTVH